MHPLDITALHGSVVELDASSKYQKTQVKEFEVRSAHERCGMYDHLTGQFAHFKKKNLN